MCSRLPDRETEEPRELGVFIIGSWMEVGAGKLLNTVERGSWLLPISKEEGLMVHSWVRRQV